MYHWPIVGTRCYYFLAQIMSSAKYISSSRRNGVGTDRVALGSPAAAPRPLSAHEIPAPVTTLLIGQNPCTQTPLHWRGLLIPSALILLLLPVKNYTISYHFRESHEKLHFHPILLRLTVQFKFFKTSPVKLLPSEPCTNK